MPASKRNRMGNLSLGSSTLFNASPVETVAAAAAGGFDAVGVRVAGRRPGDGGTPVIGNAAAIRDLCRRRDDAGIAITHVTAYWVTPELSLPDFLPVVDAAAALGAATIVVNCGDPDEARFASFLASYCEAAARHRLALALEFMPYSDAKTIEQAARMVRRAAQSNLGLMIDPLHLARSGGTPADVRRVEPGLIHMVQLCDAPLAPPAAAELRHEALADRLYPGEGGLPLHELLDAVPPQVQLDVETPCRQHAGLAPDEQARIAGAKCRRFLATHATRKNP
jgi:sugar phosphate isomerase/epimerase